MDKFRIQRVAVLGAGVMGAQIAGHLANAGIAVDLFDLPGPAEDRNQIVSTALQRLKKLEPAPLASPAVLGLIRPNNFDDHLQRLAEAQLIIEAVAERMDIKRTLYAKIAPYCSASAWIASNTSGLSVRALAAEIPPALRPRFCGMHFFNPPRYMSLVELIPCDETRPEGLDTLESWLVHTLGKSVIRAKDTPNFIANRIGVFSLLATMEHTQRLGLGLDTVDALTGPRIGRPKSACYRTVDVVGIDTLAHVVHTKREQLRQDPWHAFFKLPTWIEQLIQEGALGQKSGRGLYKKEGKDILVLDYASGQYRKTDSQIDPEVEKILALRQPAEKFTALIQSPHPQAQLLWATFRDVFHYSAVHLHEIADNARDLDLAMRWGFGWSHGPFELWQAAGWAAIAQAIEADRKAGKTLSDAALPDWCFTPARTGVHQPDGSWAPAINAQRGRSRLEVYRRQLFPELLMGEQARPSAAPISQTAGETLYQNKEVRLWRLPDVDAGIGILSFASTMHSVSDEVLAGMMASIAIAEAELDGLVLWHEPPFCVGANLKQVAQACKAGEFTRLEQIVAQFQAASQALKYARVPTVAATQGLALGGGCEFLMHAQQRVMHLETYTGLVEAGVGVIPAGGGCKEFAVRAAQWAARSPTPGEVFPFIQQIFTTIAMAKVAKSSHQAVEMGFAQPQDATVFHAHELLYAGLRAARSRADLGYTPPIAQSVPVAGRTGIANLSLMLVNMHEGRMISDHDYKVAHAAATALCGGDIDPGTRVDEDWLIRVERQLFVDLLKTPETQARIEHMLSTGKPLRN